MLQNSSRLLFVCILMGLAQSAAVAAPPEETSDTLFKVPSGVRKLTVEVELDSSYPDQQTVKINGGWITRVELKMEKRPQTQNVVVDPSKRSWGPEQATGKPDTPQAGDIRTAWASLTQDNQPEWLLLKYAQQIKPTAIIVYETYNPGAINKISVFDPQDKETVVWQLPDNGMGINTSNGYPGIQKKNVNGVAVSTFSANVDSSIKRVKLYLDSPRVKGWNEIDAVGVVDDKGNTHWAASAEASSSYAQNQQRQSAPTPRPKVKIPEGAVTLSHVGDTSSDKRSLGGSGHAVAFDRPTGAKTLAGIQIYASRYGHRAPPAENFHVYLLDENMKVLKDMPYPYSMIERTSAMRWYTLPFPAIDVPEKFFIALSFNPHQTKGIYLGLDKTVRKSHSYFGLPDDGYKPLNEVSDWMVRAYFVSNADLDAAKKDIPICPPVTKRMIDGIPVEIVRITDNNHNDRYPEVSGANVVWRGPDGNSSETWLYNGHTIRQISQNTRSGGKYANDHPVIDGSRIAWMGYYKNYDIILYDGTKSTKLTNSHDHERNPQISGSNVVWQCPHGADNEIFLFNGSTTKPLTDNDYEDLHPQVSGSIVVWQGKNGEDWEIFIYDGNKVQQITDNNYNDLSPQVSGSSVVWQGKNGEDWEIFLYDGSTIKQLTNNKHDDTAPRISGSNIVWQGSDGNDTEIFVYDGSTTKQLTNNVYNDTSPCVSNSNVAWLGNDGDKKEVFFYDGRTTIQLTTDKYDKEALGLSGSNVVWLSHDGNDLEVFLARIVCASGTVDASSPAKAITLKSPPLKTANPKPEEFHACVLGQYCMLHEQNPHPFAFIGQPVCNLYTEQTRRAMAGKIDQTKIAWVGRGYIYSPRDDEYLIVTKGFHIEIDGMFTGISLGDNRVKYPLEKGLHEIILKTGSHGQPFIHSAHFKILDRDETAMPIVNRKSDIENFLSQTVNHKSIKELSGWKMSHKTRVKMDRPVVFSGQETKRPTGN